MGSAGCFLFEVFCVFYSQMAAGARVITYYRINIFNMLVVLSASHHETASFRKASDLVCFVCYHVQSTEEQFLAWEIFTE